MLFLCCIFCKIQNCNKLVYSVGWRLICLRNRKKRTFWYTNPNWIRWCSIKIMEGRKKSRSRPKSNTVNFLCPSAWMNSFLLLLKYPSSQTLLELKEFEFQISTENTFHYMFVYLMIWSYLAENSSIWTLQTWAA